jgi:hypothetical protein
LPDVVKVSITTSPRVGASVLRLYYVTGTVIVVLLLLLRCTTVLVVTIPGARWWDNHTAAHVIIILSVVVITSPRINGRRTGLVHTAVVARMITTVESNRVDPTWWTRGRHWPAPPISVVFIPLAVVGGVPPWWPLVKTSAVV